MRSSKAFYALNPSEKRDSRPNITASISSLVAESNEFDHSEPRTLGFLDSPFVIVPISTGIVHRHLAYFLYKERGLKWSVQEDVILCKAWISISEDGAVGTNQSLDSFWTRIQKKCEEYVQTFNRSKDSCHGRWRVINQECSLFRQSLTKANASPASGGNQSDVDLHARTIFINDNKGKAFKFDHAWNLVGKCPKWLNFFESPIHVGGGSSSTPNRFENPINRNLGTLSNQMENPIIMGDGSSSSPLEETTSHTNIVRRPMGRDKQKAYKRKQPEDDRRKAFDDNMTKLIKQGEILASEAQKRSVGDQRAIDFEIRKHNDMILTMDLSKLSPRKQQYFRNEQDIILGKTKSNQDNLSYFSNSSSSCFGDEDNYRNDGYRPRLSGDDNDF